MRAAIYARYSSDNQRQASIEDQVRLCLARIEQEGWTLAATYKDAAISGATHLRPGYQKLLEEARNGAIEVIVAEALDRLSRDQADVAGFYKQLVFSGVKLVTLAEGEVNELHVGLKGTMNALFLKDLAAKTWRGLEGRVRQGHSGGGLCYGYDTIRRVDDRGEPIRGERAINEAQAVIVRRIFAEFASGRSPRAIAHRLNADGVVGPGGQGWGASTINGNAARGTGILNNELYIGRLVWNRLRYIKDPDSGKRVSRPNPDSELVIREVPELRIVPQELWDAAKARQAVMTRATRQDLASKPFWDRQRPRYLFSGLMRCGACGGSYTKISAHLFGCATARNKGTCANRLNIRRDELEAAVLNGLQRHLMDPALFKVFADELVREVNRLRMADLSRARQAQSELAKVERRLRRIVDAIADGAPARTLADELAALEAKRDLLERQVAGAKEPEPLLHPNLAELYRKHVAALVQALDSEDTRPEAMDVIRSLIEAIVLVPDNGVLRIELRGELAGILRLCADAKKKPGAQGAAGLVEQVKMVAGRGFEPLTFRL